MELIDKYIYAIGKKLPIKSKKEIEKELKSLILDEIEAKYGNNPSDDDLREYINDFGSPNEVASRYRKNDSIILNEYSTIYFSLIKIVTFALCVAFSIVFIINLIINFENFYVMKNILSLFSNIISSSLSAIGALTIVFILISRNFEDSQVDFEIPWNAKELDAIVIKKQKESKVSIAVEVILSIIFLSLLRFAPRFINFAQISFEKSTITLGHYLNIELFENLLFYISIIWVLEIIALILKLIIEETKITDLLELILNVINVGFLIYLVQLDELYLNYQSIIGFRLIFLIVLIVSIIELISNIFSFIKYYIFEK